MLVWTETGDLFCCRKRRAMQNLEYFTDEYLQGRTIEAKACTWQVVECWSKTLPSMKTSVDLWSNIIAMELPFSHIPSLLEPFLI